MFRGTLGMGAGMFNGRGVGCVAAVLFFLLMVAIIGGLLALVTWQVIEGGPAYQNGDATYGTR